MSWPEHILTSWNDFTTLASRLGQTLRPFSSRYIFRGAGDATWGLTTTLARSLGDISAINAVTIESQSLASFKAAIRLWPEVQTPSDPGDRFDWWALMQHHGAPTRLLDWTASIYVAAYFAVETHWETDGVISFFDAHRLANWYTQQRLQLLASHAVAQELWSQPDHLEDGLLDDPNAPDVIVPSSMSRFWAPRMVAQQGHFTMSLNVLGNHGTIIENALQGFTNDSIWAYGQFVIPAAQKPEYLKNLSAMNVTAASLFPNVDGFGRSINSLVKLEAWRIHSGVQEPHHFQRPTASRE